jgi:ubiquinone/menaquinone biosynthesis C-methylase UbiE
MQNPEDLVGPHIEAGMTVLEPGPGMGFFTLPMAEMVGSKGRVVAVDIQSRMLDGLRRRAAKAGLTPRLDARLAEPGSLGVNDLSGTVDFVLACAVVHEMPSSEAFFREAAAALKPGGTLLLVEPAGHVNPAKFAQEIDVARRAGLEKKKKVLVRHCLAAVLAKKAA